jgi:hypothetical protein
MVELQAKAEVLSEKPDPVPVMSTIIRSQTSMGLRPSLRAEKPVDKSLCMTKVQGQLVFLSCYVTLNSLRYSKQLFFSVID